MTIALRTPALLVAAAAAVALAGCSSPKSDTAAGSSGASSGTSASGATQASGSCSPASLATTTKGNLTIATDTPAYEPWFVDNKPSNGKGFESAVGYAIASQLGYSKDKVTWVTEPFNNAITPGKKNFDFDLNEVSISADRAKAVDFSSGYYDVVQAVITTKGSKIDGKTSIASLKDAKLGAQVGSTSYDAIVNQIKPSQTPAVFDTNAAAAQALKNHQIDGLVVDLPTAFYMTSAQLTDGVIVGQLPVAGKPEQFGALLTKGSPLTSCVTKAVDALRANGELTKLADEWLAKKGAPKLS